MAPICQVHQVEMKWKPPGTSKTGKPYQGFWSCGQKNPDGSWCNYKPPQAPEGRQGASVAFQQGLEASGQQIAAQSKDVTITRLAICKSLVERGEKWSPAAKAEAEAWLAWVENKQPNPVKAPEIEEIKLSDIPF